MKVQQVFNATGGKAGLVKMWEPEGFPFEQGAVEQIHNMARMPFIHKHVAVMPDAHAGKGSTIGTVIATKGAIIPAAVGVDIGCGMMAIRTNMTSHDLPENLHAVRTAIEAAVPHGRTDNGGPNDRGAWGDVPAEVGMKMLRHIDVSGANLQARYDAIVDKHPLLRHRALINQLGSLGTGNHFIEICLDEDDRVWAMLHSGSRGAGNRIGSYFIEKAQREMERYHVAPYLADKDLSYLVEHTELFDDYVEAVGWAQDYAMANREVMMAATLSAMRATIRPDFEITDAAINCHHNYVTTENHFGANVLVTRKGAVQARRGTMGIIPGSMGTGSFIVRGKGNQESFCSCSHGAGRTMSRTKAKATVTMAQHAHDMQGIEARLDADILDETPRAYKPIGAVMAAQADLVEIVHTLRQIVNVKG